MRGFLELVADLTDPRNVGLDDRLASLALDLVEASDVLLWRWTARDKHVAPGQRFAGASSALSFEGVPPRIEACRLAAQPSSRRDVANGLCLHLFPVTDKDESGLAVEIVRYFPLAEVEANAVLTLARIYRNVLGHLESSRHDALTGLLNRRTFDTSFEQALEREDDSQNVVLRDRRDASENGTAPHIAVVDIDHFKRINDRFGHLYGDEVLVLLARLMKRCFRETDNVFRFGGEEFVVILLGTTPAQAHIALERFRTSVERFAFPQVGTVTVSIGFTMIKADDNGPNAFGRADDALYVAKRSGRNQICSHETLTTTGVLSCNRAQHEHNVEMFG